MPAWGNAPGTLCRNGSALKARPSAPTCTTLAALLNSLQMGFRTLTVQKRSSEVWNLLATVKTEFGKFGSLLEGVKKKLDQASNQIDDAAQKSRTIERRLNRVEALPSNPQPLLPELLSEPDIEADE